MVVKGEKIAFPGGGTHFHYGADKYIALIANVSQFVFHSRGKIINHVKYDSFQWFKLADAQVSKKQFKQ